LKAMAGADKKLKIGIPRALLYHKYGTRWEAFWRALGADAVVSPQTNRQIIARGINLAVDESCLSVKIYLGHVDWLKDKCDAVFVPHYERAKRNEEICVKFMGLNDIVRNTFRDIKIIDYTVDAARHKNEFWGLFWAGCRVCGNPLKSFAACLRAQASFEQSEAQKMAGQKEKIEKTNGAEMFRILMISHPYTARDNFLGKPITNFLEKLGAAVIYSDSLDHRVARGLSQRISKSLYWTFHKELVGAVEFYRNLVDGIVFLSTFPCGPDSLMTQLCQGRLEGVPNITITLDELEGEAGIRTRLESFIDMLRARKTLSTKP